MSDNHKKITHKRKMVVTFVNGDTRSVILKGDLGEMEELVISNVGDSIRDNEPFYLIEGSTIVNPRNITTVTFGPVEEHDGA